MDGDELFSIHTAFVRTHFLSHLARGANLMRIVAHMRHYEAAPPTRIPTNTRTSRLRVGACIPPRAKLKSQREVIAQLSRVYGVWLLHGAVVSKGFVITENDLD